MKGLIASPAAIPMAQSLRFEGRKGSKKPGLTVDVDISLRSRKFAESLASATRLRIYSEPATGEICRVNDMRISSFGHKDIVRSLS